MRGDPFYLQPIIDEFTRKVREHSYQNAIAFRLTITKDEVEAEWKTEDLSNSLHCSTQNMRGEPIIQ